MPVRGKRYHSDDLLADSPGAGTKATPHKRKSSLPSPADLKKAVGGDGHSTARHGRRRSLLASRRRSEETNVQVPPAPKLASHAVRPNAPPAAALSHRHGQRTSLTNALHRKEEDSPAQAPLEALEA